MPRHRSPAGRRLHANRHRHCALVLCLTLLSTVTSAQERDETGNAEISREPAESPGCSDAACQARLRAVGGAAARTSTARAAFVSALRHLIEGTAGVFGDEGPRIRAVAGEMRSALTQWDAAIGAYRAALNAIGPGVEAHAALGSVYLDRGLAAQAAEEFRRAVDLNPRWSEAFLLLALARDGQGNTSDATKALAAAGRLDPGHAGIGYARVQEAVRGGDEGAISRALLEFGERRAHVPPAAAAAPAAPFVRLGLLRETAGAAPIFSPALYAETFRLLSARRYDEAVAALQRAVDRDPLAATSDDLTERVRAGSDLRAGNITQAIARLEQAVMRWPDASEPRRLLAAAYAADERYEQSIEQATGAIQRQAHDERARLALAEVLAANGQRDAAERTLLDTIAALPDAGRAYYQLGRLHQSESRTSDALADFTASAAHAILVGRDLLFETIAALHVSEGDFSQAIAAYRLELDANPNNASAHRRLGDLYAQDGRLGESLAELAAALLIDPANADAHASRAQTLLRLSRFADAEAAARRAVAVNPAHEAAQYALGTALIRVGRTEEGLAALGEFERLQAATRSRNDAAWQVKLLREQALERAEQHDYRAAADLLRRASAYAPTDGSVHLAAGVLLMRAGDYTGAIVSLTHAVERQAPEAHRYLADAYDAIGRSEDSLAHRAAYDAVKKNRLRKATATP